MKIPKRGEKGFTLIELLIVVAILGVLAAVVIPNVGRFIGRGETEAKDTEFANIQSAVVAMMTDLSQPTLANPESSATSNMSSFPDSTNGYVLYANNKSGSTVNYLVTEITTGTYTVNTLGTVVQESTGYE